MFSPAADYMSRVCVPLCAATLQSTSALESQAAAYFWTAMTACDPGRVKTFGVFTQPGPKAELRPRQYP